MRYEPDRFDINVGQVVRFEVTNSGEVRHEFFVGTTDEHREHADELAAPGTEYLLPTCHPTPILGRSLPR